MYHFPANIRIKTKNESNIFSLVEYSCTYSVGRALKVAQTGDEVPERWKICSLYD